MLRVYVTMDLTGENFCRIIYYDFKFGLTPQLRVARLQTAFGMKQRANGLFIAGIQNSFLVIITLLANFVMVVRLPL